MSSHSMSIFSDFEHAWKSKLYVGLASPFGTDPPIFVNKFTSSGDQWCIHEVHLLEESRFDSATHERHCNELRM